MALNLLLVSSHWGIIMPNGFNVHCIHSTFITLLTCYLVKIVCVLYKKNHLSSGNFLDIDFQFPCSYKIVLQKLHDHIHFPNCYYSINSIALRGHLPNCERVIYQKGWYIASIVRLFYTYRKWSPEHGIYNFVHRWLN